MSLANCKLIGANINPKEYHTLKAEHPRGHPQFVMSPSSMNAFAIQPKRWFKGWNPKGTKAQKWGDLVDCRSLTPELFNERFVIRPDQYPASPKKKGGTGAMKPWSSNSNWCRDWLANQAEKGREVVTKKQMTDCDAALVALFEDEKIKLWYEECDRQVLITGEWHDEDTELVIPVSCLLDFVPRSNSEFSDSLGDFKSAISAHSLKFQRKGFDLGYHRQAAFDMDMYNAATGEQRTTWCFIIQESFEPWMTNRAIYGQSGDMGQPSFLDLGRDESFGGYRAILANYCKCVKHGEWPGYNDIDEEVQGWSILRPEPFMAERLMFAQKFKYPMPEPVEDEAPMESDEDVTP